MRSRSSLRQLAAGRRWPAPSMCSPKTSAGGDVVEAVAGSTSRARWSRSLPYIAAPSVATVTMTSSGAEAEVLRGLDRRRGRCRCSRGRATAAREHVASGHAARAGEVVRGPTSVSNSTPSRSVARSEIAGHDVGVHHVVDQRDVLVADPLDVVLAEAVAEHRRALERLDRDDQRRRSAPSGSRRRRSCPAEPVAETKARSRSAGPLRAAATRRRARARAPVTR